MPTAGDPATARRASKLVAPTEAASPVAVGYTPGDGADGIRRESPDDEQRQPRPHGTALGLDIAAVMTSSAATGVLGFAFWTAAARGYATAEVGRASAIISSATFIAILANFSLGSLYERFLPLAGRLTQRLVRHGTVFAGTVGLFFGAVFLLIGPRHQLFPNWYEAALFPAFVAVLSVYALQDQVLIGLSRARTIAKKNIGLSITKLIAVVALVPLASGAAIVGSWVVPAAVITAVIAVRVIRREAAGRTGPPALPPTRELFEFFASSYIISAVTVSVPLLVPLLVVARLGTEMNAYFSMCWLVIQTLGVLIGATAAPFIATASTPGADLRSCTVRFVVLCGGAALVGCLLLIAAAPLVLGILGPGYAEHGIGLMRVMALILPSIAVMTIYTALARLRRRLRLAVTAQILLGTTVVAGVVVTTPRWGLIAVGFSYLAAELMCTALILVPTIVQLRRAMAGPQNHENGPPGGSDIEDERRLPVRRRHHPPVGEIGYRSVTERFEQVARSRPHRIALRSDTGTVDYGGLAAAAAGWRAELAGRGVRSAVLPLVGELDPRSAAVILGAFAAGIPLVPLDPALPADRMRQILDTLQRHGYRPESIDVANPSAPRVAELPSPSNLHTVTSIQFTSGSTGEPKAVLHTHGTWLSDWTLHRDRFGIEAGRRVALTMPVTFAAGLNVFIGSLLSGAEILAIEPRRHGPDSLPDLLDDVDILMCTPSLLQAVVQHACDRTLPRLQRIVTTGEPVYGNLFRSARRLAPNAVLTNWAGSSETLGIAHFDIWPGEPVPAGAIPAGTPVPHKELDVDDRGLLTVTSRYLAAGYLDPDRAETRFLERPDGRRTFVTNDRARREPDGTWVILGRADAAAKIRGYLVEPAEVEAALLDCPGIREAVVVADHTGTTPTLIGYLTPRPDVRTPAVADIRAHLHTVLPDWMVPAHLILLESLPRNDRGKVDRRALPPPVRGPVTPPESGLEAEIAAIWADTLRLDEVGRDENLYALGGDSITALQLAATIGRRYRVRLTSADLAAAPHVAQLAAVVEARRAGNTGSRSRTAPTTVLLRTPTAESRDILFCFAGAGASALSFAPLTEHLDDRSAVVAFQPQGLLNRAVPDWTVNRAARRHLRDLLTLQPHGPYTLVGHSLGAFIAVEVAHRLRELGHRVESVTLLDPILSLPYLRSVGAPAAAGAGQRPVPMTLWKHRLGLPLAGLLDGGPQRKEAALREVGVRVARMHRPRPYPGRALLMLSNVNGVDDRVWRRLFTGEVTIERLPCDHDSVIREPHIARVAAALTATRT